MEDHTYTHTPPLFCICRASLQILKLYVASESINFCLTAPVHSRHCAPNETFSGGGSVGSTWTRIVSVAPHLTSRPHERSGSTAADRFDQRWLIGRREAWAAQSNTLWLGEAFWEWPPPSSPRTVPTQGLLQVIIDREYWSGIWDGSMLVDYAKRWC